MNVKKSKMTESQNKLRLWYRQPAECWREALPLGNGRMGAMIYGDTNLERIDLSDITCFSGEASLENNQEGAAEFFQKARTSTLAGDFEGARQHLNGFIGKRLNYGTNLPLGHLIIESKKNGKSISEYKRSLQLDTALTEVYYTNGSSGFVQNAFISNPHQVLVIKIAASCPSKLDLAFSLDGGDNPYYIETAENGDLLLFGNAYESIHSDGKTGVAFHGRLRVFHINGTRELSENRIHIRQSDEILLLLALATNFDISAPQKHCLKRINEASALSYEELLDAHLRDYTPLFSRVSLELGKEIPPDIPTDILLGNVKNGGDSPALLALMFQYGRYLLIASSREDSPLPTHLQGVWNDSVACRIGWTCDMHLDINTQMNYWPAEVTNLSECHEPLFRWIEKKLVPSGRITAAKAYGFSGWVAELVSNCWGFTAPYWHTNLSPCPTGGVWVLTHLWEHYLFTGDDIFLKNHAYPIIREAVEFFIDYIFEDPKTGYLTSGPSISPENSFKVGNEIYTASIGPVYETVMIRELFVIFIKAYEILKNVKNGDAPAEMKNGDILAEKAKKALAQLTPFTVGSNGELKEWEHDFASPDPQHRHTSHLLALFPFSQINPDQTPELVKAAKICLRQRMTPEENWEDTGWARSMLMLYSARMRDNEAVHAHITSMQKYLTNNNLMVKHPPTRGAPSFADVYELDGNTGMTACIAETLLQSYQDEIHLLPALPRQWSNGYVKGLCARGGYEVDITWADGILKEAVIHAKFNATCTVRYGTGKLTFPAEAGGSYVFDGNLNHLP